MSDRYYIRIRGEIRGPIARSELVAQIRKKRIGRHHEVSEDSVNWMRAGDVPDLFEPVVAERPQAQEEAQTSPRRSESAHESPERRSEESSTGAQWYYASGKNRLGPVSEAELRSLILAGRVGQSDLIWHQGLTDWQEAQLVPQFAALIPRETSRPQESPSTNATGSEITVLTSTLFALHFACISLLCAPLVLFLWMSIIGSKGVDSGVPLIFMLFLGTAFGAVPVFSGIVGIFISHQSIRITNSQAGKYRGAGFAWTALIICYAAVVATLITVFVFLIVIGVKSA
jgi:hypothetical protein